MAILRPKEIRKLSGADRAKRLQELRLELAKERAQTRVGANAASPGRVREIRRTIARLHTIAVEQKKGVGK